MVKEKNRLTGIKGRGERRSEEGRGIIVVAPTSEADLVVTEIDLERGVRLLLLCALSCRRSTCRYLKLGSHNSSVIMLRIFSFLRRS